MVDITAKDEESRRWEIIGIHYGRCTFKCTVLKALTDESPENGINGQRRSSVVRQVEIQLSHPERANHILALIWKYSRFVSIGPAFSPSEVNSRSQSCSSAEMLASSMLGQSRQLLHWHQWDRRESQQQNRRYYQQYTAKHGIRLLDRRRHLLQCQSLPKCWRSSDQVCWSSWSWAKVCKGELRPNHQQPSS